MHRFPALSALLVACATAATACTMAPPDPGEHAASTSSAILYGSDPRFDYFQSPVRTPVTAAAWNRTVLVIGPGGKWLPTGQFLPSLVPNAQGYTLNTVPLEFTFLPQVYGEFALCPGQAFAGQPEGVGGYCSGVLVSELQVATAGHCLGAGPAHVVFSFDQESPTTTKTTFAPFQVYDVVAQTGAYQAGTYGPDWAILTLDRPVTYVSPAPMAHAPAPGASLFMVGHPLALPKKITLGGSVLPNAPNAPGTLSNTLVTSEGNSGSGVFDAATGALVGIQDAVDNTPSLGPLCTVADDVCLNQTGATACSEWFVCPPGQTCGSAHATPTDAFAALVRNTQLGAVESFDGVLGVFHGWSVDPLLPSQPSGGVMLAVDGALVQDFNEVADLPNPAANAAGFPGNHGFAFQIPGRFRDGQPHVFEVLGSNVAHTAFDLLDSRSFTFTDIVEGAVTSVAPDGTIQGWAADPKDPANELTVYFSVDAPWGAGSTGTIAKATQPTPASPFGANQGFATIPLCNWLRNDQAVVHHEVFVTLGPSNATPLSGSPVTVTCYPPGGWINGASGFYDGTGSPIFDWSISGYAGVVDYPTTQMTVTLSIDGVPIGTFPANQTGVAVSPSWPMASGAHGFSVPVPVQYYDGKVHYITGTWQDTRTGGFGSGALRPTTAVPFALQDGKCGDGKCSMFEDASSCPGDCEGLVGCYVDAATRLLPVQLPGSDYTIESCRAAALQQGYAYAGLEYYGQCFAGSTLPLQLASAQCLTPCNADGLEGCGGTWAVRVFDACPSGQKMCGPTRACVPEATACCGDGACNDGETCSSCAADCGACPFCGDGECNGGETCSTCGGDCGACVGCGDGRCAAGETCSSCPSDCGACEGGCRAPQVFCDCTGRCTSAATCAKVCRQ